MVYRLDPDGGNPKVVFFTGGVVSAAGRAVGSTTGVEYGSRLMHECQEKVPVHRDLFLLLSRLGTGPV